MSTVCPTFDDLAAYSLGILPRERSEEIDMHLDECTACQGELETCGNADDTFLSRLREPESSEGFLVEAECADLLDRVAAIGREASFVAQRKPDEATAASSSLGDIGPYRLLATLGAGGMGTVYKAFHTRLERLVALKMLPPDRMRDEQAIVRFEREMKAVGKLDHPNIVRATDAGDDDGKHFLVMEYVEGTDLSDLVRQSGPLPIADACEIVRQAAVGLQHAHEHDLVHRDIKPSNLMLNTDSTVKVLDLGLALLPSLGEAGRELTDTGQAMGTLDYMAPEQGGDSHDVDIRADIYSLGATLYKLLTGHVIFGGPQYQTQMQKWKAACLTGCSARPVSSRRYLRRVGSNRAPHDCEGKRRAIPNSGRSGRSAVRFRCGCRPGVAARHSCAANTGNRAPGGIFQHDIHASGGVGARHFFACRTEIRFPVHDRL